MRKDMGKRKINENAVQLVLLGIMLALAAAAYYVLWENVPRAEVRHTLLILMGLLLITAAVWMVYLKRRVSAFADDLCETLDALIAGRQPDNFHPYEDNLTTKVQGKLLQYYDIMQDGKLKSQQDRQTLQEIISDISHQVKTPIANIKMFHGILKQREMSGEKRQEFFSMMEKQIEKLDFLIQSLIKMSRLETGTFALCIEEANLYDTIARAFSGVWAKAEQKNITINVECDCLLTVRHDPKWTAEALMNILDNAVKYTPEGGSITVNTRPWQFYTRIDITDTGIGIEEKHYHDVFKRFYRAQEVAEEEGVGLGLYLAQGIVTRQKGYISVKSQAGKGTTFSVYMQS